MISHVFYHATHRDGWDVCESIVQLSLLIYITSQKTIQCNQYDTTSGVREHSDPQIMHSIGKNVRRFIDEQVQVVRSLTAGDGVIEGLIDVQNKCKKGHHVS